MKILAVETATAVCGVALIEDETPRSERSLSVPHVHSEKLVTLIDEVLRETQLSLQTIDGIAVSAGPGSFTGLRIGFSTVKGLAFAHDIPLVAVPTLKALAYNVIRHRIFKPEDIVLPLIDARREDVYAAQYKVQENNLAELMEVRICSLSEVYQHLPKQERVIVLGDGAEKFRNFLKKEHASDSTRFINPESLHCVCSASSVGIIGGMMLRNGDVAETASLEPLYIKDFYTTMKRQQAQVQ